MKKTLIIAVLVATFSAVTMAADSTPTLFESTGMDRSKASITNTPNKTPAITRPYPVPQGKEFCVPTPEPACPPPAPVVSNCNVCGTPVITQACTATPACSDPVAAVCPPPAKARRTAVNAVKMVPSRQKIVEEETYLVHEPRTGSYPELRTRTAKRTIELPTTKMVTEAKILHVKPESGESMRLARGVDRKVVVTTRKEVQEFQEEYMAQVKYNFTVPIAKKRKVTRTVESYTPVAVRGTAN